MNAADSPGRRRATAPVSTIVVVLIALLALTAASRAHAADAPRFTLAGASGIFGKQTPGAEWQKMTENAKRGSRFLYDGPAGTELHKVTGVLRGVPSEDGVQTVDVAVYADQDGNPGALLARSAENAVIAGRQGARPVDFPLTQTVPLKPGDFYWLMYHAGGDIDVAEYSYDIANIAFRFEQKGEDVKADGPEDPAGPMAPDAKVMWVWGHYRPAATGPTTPLDRDTDGVPDADDLCPDVAGPAAAAGCPGLTTPSAPDPPAPTPPGVATSGVQDRTADSTTLTGFVVPQGDTTWFFEWGPVGKRMRRTAEDVVPAGAGATQVEAPLTGLRPRTRYAYRLVARGPDGREVRGTTRRFVSLPLPSVEAQFFMSVTGRSGARSRRVSGSSLVIRLLEPSGRLASAARHAGLRVRVVLRRSGRAPITRSFRAGTRVRVAAIGSRRRVTLRPDVTDRVGRYTLGGLFRAPMAAGTRLEVFVTGKRTTGAYSRVSFRWRGKRGFGATKVYCELPVGTRRPRDCHPG